MRNNFFRSRGSRTRFEELPRDSQEIIRELHRKHNIQKVNPQFRSFNIR